MISGLSSLKKGVGLLLIITPLLTIFYCGSKRNDQRELKQQEAPQREKKEEIQGPLRPANFAGSWYPGNREKLTQLLRDTLEKAKPEDVKGNILGILSPHAGYMYCWHVAAHGYKLLQGRSYDTVILLGPSHRGGILGGAIFPSGAFHTPLGDVPIDTEMAQEMMAANPNIRYFPRVHEGEHSLEMQLPFLQHTLKKFKLLPLLIRAQGPKDYTTLAKSIVDAAAGKNVLLAVSTDLSHYPPYEEAVKADSTLLEAFKTLDWKEILKVKEDLEAKGIPNYDCAMCGDDAVLTGLTALKMAGCEELKVLKYANSGDVEPSRRKSVVGYCSAVALGTLPWKISEKGNGPMEKDVVGKEGQKILLRIARETAAAAVAGKKLPEYQFSDPELLQQCGAFVTLKNKGRLRGCIGNFSSTLPLYKLIQNMAVASSTQDDRFRDNPITPQEIPELTVEISVLSPMRKIRSAEEFQLGVHGIVVKQGMNQATFLPQVAHETGWDKEKFLSQCCLKGWMPPDAWKKEDTELFVYTAFIFGDAVD